MHAVILAAALTTAAAAQCPILFPPDLIHTPAVPEAQRTLAADIDQDGRTDLITLSRRAPLFISILWGRGDGTFEAPQIITNSVAGEGIALGDLNGDGRLELVFTPNSGSTALSVVTFHPDRTVSLQNAPVVRNGFVADITLTDLDADGRLDAAFVTSTATFGIRFARGNGAGGFTLGPFGAFTPATNQNTRAVAAAAIRSPTQPDLLITTSGGGASQILTARFQGWNSPPTFTAPRDLARTHTHIAVSDFDRDGRDDLVLDTFDGASGGISVLTGLADGSFGPERYTPAGTTQPLAMDTADLDGDGRDEVVITNPAFTVFRNSGPDGFIPTFYNHATFGNRTVSIGDFDFDGRPDVALTTGGGFLSADVIVNTGSLPPVRPVLDPIVTCPGQQIDARITVPRFSAVSWQFLAPAGWTNLPEGGAITTPTGETFGTATNTDNFVLHIAVSQSCCFTAHTALIRALAANVCGTTIGPPIHLTLCRADFTCDGFLDFFDYDGFVESFLAGESSTDFNADGFLDFFDYDDFVASFEGGCS